MQDLVGIALVVALCGLTACAEQGYWRYTHSAKTPADVKADLAMCKIGARTSVRTPPPADREQPGWGATDLGNSIAAVAQREQHKRLCMTALHYQRKWFDAAQCKNGCLKKP